jgi:hypothetical protein
MRVASWALKPWCKVPSVATAHSKVVDQRTKMPAQDEEQWRYTCAHPKRGEAEEGQRQCRRWDRSASIRSSHAAAVAYRDLIGSTSLKCKRMLPVLKYLRAVFVRCITLLFLSSFAPARPSADTLSSGTTSWISRAVSTYRLSTCAEQVAFAFGTCFSSTDADKMCVEDMVKGRSEFGNGRTTNHHNSAESCPIKTTKWQLIIFGFFKCGFEVLEVFQVNLRFQLESSNVTSSWSWSKKLKMKMDIEHTLRT